MPRRSNGCVTCKRRKVKCDEEKPTCQRCARQGYECEGYAEHTPTRRRSPTFRDQTRQVAARAEASYARGPVPVRTPQLPKNLHLIEEDEFPTLLMCPSPRLNYLPSISAMDTSRERRMQLLSNFIHNFLPHSYASIPASHYSYMYVLPDILGQHPAIPSAVDALCLYSAGKTLGDEDIVAKSKTIYGAALSRLARNLERTHYFAPTGTMAAIILLAWCELNRGTSSNPDAWENHLVGATSLLESFDPEVWDTNQGRLLIQAVRYMLTCTGILKRRSVIFTRPHWARLMAGSEDENEWLSLMDESAKIPGLLEETDITFSSQNTNPSEAQELADRCFELRARMLEWYDRLLSTSEPDTAKLVSIDGLEWWQATPYDSAFPFVYYFSCCKQCYVRLQFWFFMLALSKNLLAIYDSGFAAWPGKFGYPSRQTIEEEVINYAVDAACCVPTAFDPVTPPVSRFNAALLIKACGETFYEYGLTEKYRWCQTMSDRLESKSFSTPKIMQLNLHD